MFWGEARRPQILLPKGVELLGEDTVLTASIGKPAGSHLPRVACQHAGSHRRISERSGIRRRGATDRRTLSTTQNSVAYALLHLALAMRPSRRPTASAHARPARDLDLPRAEYLILSGEPSWQLVGHAQVRSGRPDEALLGLREGLAIQEAMGYRSTMSVIADRCWRRRTSLPGNCLPRQTTLDVPSPWRASAVKRFEEARASVGSRATFMPHPDHLDA